MNFDQKNPDKKKLEDIKAEKFPRILKDGRRLIWDSRQESTGEKELVLLYPVEGLKNRGTDALFVGPKGSGADVEVANLNSYLAQSAAEFFGHPSQKMTVLAVTGTNGKTTCARLSRVLMAGLGSPIAELGTLGLSVWQGEKKVLDLQTGYTTPTAPMLQSLLFQLLNAGVGHLVMEASSHALAESRVEFVDFDGALFTNLSLDHLDFHRNMEAYEAAKTLLFLRDLAPERSLKKKFAVLNTRDSAGKRIFEKVKEKYKVLDFNLGLNCRVLESSLAGLSVQSPDGVILDSPLVGDFNAENMLGSWLLVKEAWGTAFREEKARESLAKFGGVPGRLQIVPSSKRAKKHVFVDYAHTPDALKKSLEVLKTLCTERSCLWVVFGCGGDRDRSKRPLMAKIASLIADRIILCSDNPRSEDPEKILDEIEDGIETSARNKAQRIEDRQEALSFLIKNMRQGDVALVAGKGHEEFQIIGNKKIPFSDLEECEKLFKLLAP